MVKDLNHLVFFELLRAGLWEKDVALRNSLFAVNEKVDWNEVYCVAKEQSVVGLVAAGINRFVVHDSRFKVPQKWTLLVASKIVQLEQRNLAMNAFIAQLIERLRKAGISALLVKGQGIAQCYERPLWRACGDIDLYLNKEDYEKAKALLIPIAQKIEDEEKKRLHLAMTIGEWVVELHGTMYTKLSRRMNRVADEVHSDIFYNGKVRSWDNNGVQVFLANANDDVIIVFNHVINHFFMEGVGLRQICDWCRLLWHYRKELDVVLLEKRIRRMGLMSEWKAFGEFAVQYLGMPVEGMPFLNVRNKMSDGGCEVDPCMKRKVDGICKYVMDSGNLGHNRDLSYRTKNPTAIVNVITLWRRICDFAKYTLLFPVDSPKFFCQYFLNRVIKAS
jgi:hypothetical protein